MANPAPQSAVHHLRAADPLHHRGGHRPRSVHQAGSERLRSGQLLEPRLRRTPLRLRPAGLRRVHPRGLRHPYLTVRRRALHATGRDCRYPDRCRRRLLRRLGRRGAEPYHRHLLRPAYAARRHRGAPDVQDLQVHLEDRAGVDALRLGRRMPYRPKRRAGIEEPRIQHRLHGPRLHACQESVPPYPAELLGPDHRHRHHFAGLLHRGRSNPKLPWRRPADHHGELGWRYLQRTDQPAD